MLPENFSDILKNEKYIFVTVSTSDLEGNPNAAYKLLVKIEDNYLYLFDYPVWKTWKNLKQNPKISISLLKEEQLNCYKINGTVEIIEEGPLRESLREEIEQKETDITVKHLVESIHDNKEYKLFEDQLSENFILYKVKVEELDEMTFAKHPIYNVRSASTG